MLKEGGQGYPIEKRPMLRSVSVTVPGDTPLAPVSRFSRDDRRLIWRLHLATSDGRVLLAAGEAVDSSRALRLQGGKSCS